MITIESALFVDRISGRAITDFLLNCTDESYRRWWPGTHRQLHLRTPGHDHIGDIVYMDEYIGDRRVRLTGVVVDALPGKKIVWRLRWWRVPLPVSLSLDLTDSEKGVGINHTIRAGFTGIGRVLDPLLRLYFSREFAKAMDHHVHTEFPLLRDRLLEPETTTAPAPPPGGQLISRRQINRAMRFARPVLVHELGQDAANIVRERVLAEYVALAPAVPVLHAPTSRMTLRIAVDSLALYRALPDDLAKDKKLTLISRFVARWMNGQFDTKLIRWVYAHRLPHLLLRRLWFVTANLLDEPHGWRFRYRAGRPDLFYEVDVTRCGIVRFLASQGTPELTPLMCQGDYQITRYLPPGVAFHRTQTIADGAPYCDFRYLTANRALAPANRTALSPLPTPAASYPRG